MKVFVKCTVRGNNIAVFSDTDNTVIVTIVDHEKQFEIGHEYELIITK